MTEPTLPSFTTRTFRHTSLSPIPSQPRRITRHARQTRSQRLVNLGLFLYSCALIAGLVIAAFS